MNDVERLHFGSALGDMLVMSCSEILVPGSSFSWLASFRGEMPTIYYPGEMRQRHFPTRDGHEIELDYGEALPEGFLGAIRSTRESQEP